MSSPYDQVKPAETYSLNLTKSVICPTVKLPKKTTEWDEFVDFRPFLSVDCQRLPSEYDFQLVRSSWFLECGMM